MPWRIRGKERKNNKLQNIVWDKEKTFGNSTSPIPSLPWICPESLLCQGMSCEHHLGITTDGLRARDRASDISRKKKQNFAGFSGANSRKNRPISRDFRGKKVKIRRTIGRFQAIFAGEKLKFAEKSAHFAGF